MIFRFLEMATDLLDSVSKSAAKLLKFVKKVSQSDNNPSNISDTEKIHVQVQLDIDAFGKYCTEIGIDVGSLASFQTLKMLIKSKQQELSEAVHPEPK